MRESKASRDHRPIGIYLLDTVKARETYGREEQAALARMLRFPSTVVDAENWRRHREWLAKTEVVMSGWGAPVFDESLMEAMPRLRAVFYGAGSVKRLFGEAFWRRGASLSCAVEANAVPVAEYALAQIHWLLKDGFRYAAEMKRKRGVVKPWPTAGAYRSTVGLVSLSRIGNLVARRLQQTDLRVVAYDPFASVGTARALGVSLVSLSELFAESDVVSLHAPLLPETRGMIDRTLLSSLRPNACLINTARGAIIDHRALVDVLTERSDLFAVLDVTDPEPLPPESPLYDLPNVVLTPHIAGSLDRECERVGSMMVAEVDRFLKGEALLHAVVEAQLNRIA